MAPAGHVLYIDFNTPRPELGNPEGHQKALPKAVYGGDTIQFPIPRDRPERILANTLEERLKRPDAWETRVYITRTRKDFTSPTVLMVISIVLLEPPWFDESVSVAKPKIEVYGREKTLMDCRLISMSLYPKAAPGKAMRNPNRLKVEIELGVYLLNGSADPMNPTKLVRGAVFGLGTRRIVIPNQDYDETAGDLRL
jgi:hypothetical protein